VGFGIRTAEQVAAVGRLADGVIVASQLIRLISEAPDPAAAERAIAGFAEEAVAALREIAGRPEGGASAVGSVR
jgi:tryptophan synthase alpha chain